LPEERFPLLRAVNLLLAPSDPLIQRNRRSSLSFAGLVDRDVPAGPCQQSLGFPLAAEIILSPPKPAERFLQSIFGLRSPPPLQSHEGLYKKFFCHLVFELSTNINEKKMKM